MQSIAHGADYVSFFRWRTCTMGTEIYWHGILDYSNRDNRRLAELGEIHQKTAALAPLAGSVCRGAFAVLTDYDNIFDARLDVWHGRVRRESEAGIFRAAQLCHAPMDYVYLTGSLDPETLEKYPVLFYPHAVILTPERAGLLERYVKEGGTLVLGCRTGYKDLTGKCPMVKLPGLLRELSGADVVDYTFVGPADGKVTVRWGNDEIEAAVFNDILEPLEGAAVLGVYKNNYYAGRAALTCREYGRGRVYYFGGAFCAKTAAVFLRRLGLAEPYAASIGVPESCEITLRQKGESSFFFVLNYGGEPALIHLKKEFRDMYTGKTAAGALELPPYGTAVFGSSV
jgi:beta-galactosidase